MTVATPQGWGGGLWGGSPWGSGDGSLSLVDAIAVRENVVRFIFTVPPVVSFLDTPFDGGDPSHYQVLPVSGVGLDGEPVRPVITVAAEVAAAAGFEGTAIDVTVDRPLTAFPAVYRAVANALVSESGAFLDPGSRQLYGLRAGNAPLTAENNVASVDLANPQVPRDLVGLAPADPTLALGTYQVAPDGDYASDSPIASYRKRVLRRAMTVPGGFAALGQGYGAGVIEDVKRPAKGAVRQRRAAVLEQQILLEPETLMVAVTIQNAPGGVTYYKIRATTKLSPNVIAIDVPVNIGKV